ncbi:Uu.00g051920.m01.CDS01 [Anthostomella pinea]|uniref:Uu.00g051920.m01.CDS01 n=1 Tax=Anthostomella pinea TaxID=933095 RepID=A0AAI8VW69_9PEZI|nr:Uu.00g051920.m01.CDS01 [Anthostomella pinea]
MPSIINNDEWDLPRLKASIGFEDDFQYLSSDDQDTEFFDVKFYPYADESHDSVFAAIVIYRLSNKIKPPYELVQLFRDDDKDALNCSCTWSKDPETDVPWLCVAGRDAKIKVYDAIHGKLVKVLVGHGGEINDLATSPDNFLLIASASDDTTIRIWSLDPAWSKQPCVCLLAGEGHTAHLLTVAFHSTGRYVLSAGHDNVVCLWTLPDLPPESSGKNPPESIVIHYPHFFTSEVHSGIVDCVAFFGDLVLSRACHEDIIVLWRIEGFSSRDPPPAAHDAPTTSDPERLTRSAFAPATASACPPQYTRLLQFFTPQCGHQFYLRFKLYQNKNRHPILAFGNAHSTIYFWDLARLISYHDFINHMKDPIRDKSQPIHRPGWLVPIQHRAKGDAVDKLKDAASDRESVVSGRTGSVDVETHVDLNTDYSQETLDSWEGKYDMTRLEEPIKAHAQSNITIKDFVGRQVAWSVGGDWCVVVGSKNLAIILQRWYKRDHKVDEKEKKSSQ